MNTNENTNTQQNVQTEAVATTETDAKADTKADTAKASDTHDKQDNTDEKTLASKVAKIRDKMQARINAEVAQKHDYKDKLADATKQIETLTQKLQAQNDSARDKSKNDGNEQLDAANKEIEELKAQITRRDQVARIDSQFKQAGVNVPTDVLNLLVPAGADEKTVNANMDALSRFYDSAYAAGHKAIMTGETPKAAGSSTKPFNMKDVSKIKDPIQRLNVIKQHLHDN